MNLAKIKSFATYHKCIKELHNAGFIIYSPSYNPYKGSLIEIIDFESEEICGNKVLHDRSKKLDEDVCFTVPTFYEVELYFNERDFQSAAADQFYSLYQSKNWKLSNDKPMKCWKCAARNWISKSKNTNQNKNS